MNSDRPSDIYTVIPNGNQSSNQKQLKQYKNSENDPSYTVKYVKTLDQPKDRMSIDFIHKIQEGPNGQMPMQEDTVVTPIQLELVGLKSGLGIKSLNDIFMDDRQKKEILKSFFTNYKEKIICKVKFCLLQDEETNLLLNNFLQIKFDQLFMNFQNLYEYYFLEQISSSNDFKYFSLPSIVIQKMRRIVDEFIMQKQYLKKSSHLIRECDTDENLILNESELEDDFYTEEQLQMCSQIFALAISQFEPENLLEKIGGFKQIKRVMDEFIEILKNSNERELPIESDFFIENYDEIAKLLSDYLKDLQPIPPEYLLTKFKPINLTNLDFFIIKVLLWGIMQRLSFPFIVISEFFGKYEKLRYVVTQIGASLELRDNEEILKHTIISLRNSTLINYMKDISHKGIQKAAAIVIDFIYGFIDVNDFLELMPTQLKKKMDRVFILNFEISFTEMLQINCSLFQLLIKDFETKMYIVKIKLQVIEDHYSHIKGNELLKALQKWVYQQQYSLPTELLMHDFDKLDLLDFFFSFYFTPEQSFSFYDLSVAKAYYSVPDILLEFWFKGIQEILKDEKTVSQIHSIILES